MFFYDPTYILVLPAIIFAFYAQSKVNSTFQKYSKISSRNNITGAQVAEKILRLYGIYNVEVERVSGNLTDHYDPKSNKIRLSENVYNSTSVASIGVAAHETGHAIQHNSGYLPIKWRNAVLPLASIGSQAAFPLVILGLIFSFEALVSAGIILFTAVVAFQLVTLPVEFNASNRAISILEAQGVLLGEELDGAKKVLRAAAMTYVAACAVALGNLLRLFAISRRDD